MYREFSWGNSLGNIHLAAGRKQKENSTIHFGDTECEVQELVISQDCVRHWPTIV